VADLAEVLRDVRLFRARLADVLDAACDGMMRELAVAVIGRELVLAPVDLAAIAAHLLAAHPAATPVRLRVAPDDVARVAGIAPVCSDPALAAGDLVLEFAGGERDARLGVRLATALEAWS
jgi:flagellar biosynthesis/type III secretory pathway protein FliH